MPVAAGFCSINFVSCLLFFFSDKLVLYRLPAEFYPESARNHDCTVAICAEKAMGSCFGLSCMARHGCREEGLLSIAACIGASRIPNQTPTKSQQGKLRLD